MPNERPNDREWWVTSEQLGLRVMVRAEDDGYIVRLWDPHRQAFLPSIREATEELLQLYSRLDEARRREIEAERRAAEEARRRAEAEARLRELEEELRRLRAMAQRHKPEPCLPAGESPRGANQ